MGTLLIATLLSLAVVLAGGALVLLVTAAGVLFASPLCAIALFGILSFRKFAKRLPDPYEWAISRRDGRRADRKYLKPAGNPDKILIKERK